MKWLRATRAELYEALPLPAHLWPAATAGKIRGRVREPGYLAVTFKDVIGREVRNSVSVAVGGGVVGCGYPPPPPGDTTKGLLDIAGRCDR